MQNLISHRVFNAEANQVLHYRNYGNYKVPKISQLGPYIKFINIIYNSCLNDIFPHLISLTLTFDRTLFHERSDIILGASPESWI